LVVFETGKCQGRILPWFLLIITWEGGLKEAPTQDEILCQPRITGHCYFLEWGYDFHEQKKIKRPVAWFGNFVSHMHNYNKMVACTFCRIKGFKHINSECVLRKQKKARDPPVMIRRLKARIPELVLQR
jgi:hypothetical protein